MAWEIKNKMIALIRQTIALLQTEAITLAIASVMLSVGVALADIYIEERAGNLIGSMGSFVAGGVLTFKALNSLYPQGSAMTLRLAALFSLSLLSSLAVMAGAVFLIVPGIFLYLRWFISWPTLVYRNSGVIDALRISWREMNGWMMPVLLVLVSFLLFIIISFIVLFICGYNPAARPNLIGAIAFNFVIYLPLMLTYIVAVACHGLASQQQAVEN